MKKMLYFFLICSFFLCCKKKETVQKLPYCTCQDYGTFSDTTISKCIFIYPYVLQYIDSTKLYYFQYAICVDSTFENQIKQKDIKDSTLVKINGGIINFSTSRNPCTPGGGDFILNTIRIKTIEIVR